MEDPLKANLIWNARKLDQVPGWLCIEDTGFQGTRAPTREPVFNNLWADPTTANMARAREVFGAHSFRWFLGEGQTEGPLLEAGLVPGEITTGMVLNLGESTAPPVSPEITVSPAESEADLERWFHICGETFGSGAEAEAQVNLPLIRQAGYVAFLARYRGEPAATALVSPGIGDAGVHSIATLPAFRGRGIGAAATWACVEQARGWGLERAALYASAQGLPVYRRIGFQPLQVLREYLPAGPA